VAKIGRPAGSKNKKTVGMIIAERNGISPLEFLLSIMDDDCQELNVRMDAAKSAAPYCHARLAQTQVELTGEVQISKVVQTIVDPEPTNS
jgi:hypothetical protein